MKTFYWCYSYKHALVTIRGDDFHGHVTTLSEWYVGKALYLQHLRKWQKFTHQKHKPCRVTVSLPLASGAFLCLAPRPPLPPSPPPPQLSPSSAAYATIMDALKSEEFSMIIIYCKAIMFNCLSK